ncbi:hypothetical protein ACLB2K_055752 [Fragaria x ananassa]
MNLDPEKRDPGGDRLDSGVFEEVLAEGELGEVEEGGNASVQGGEAVGEKQDLSLDRFQIKMEEPIYDTVDDDEFGDFIEDDDGLGYLDDGEEDDWTSLGNQKQLPERE